MGVEDLLEEKPKEGLDARIKNIGKIALENIVDLIPITGAACAGIATYYIVGDTLNLGNTTHLPIPFTFNALLSSLNSFFSYNILLYLTNRKVLKKLPKLEAEKTRYKTMIGKTIDWFFKHPATTALIPTAYLISTFIPGTFDMLQPAYELKSALNNPNITFDMFPDEAKKMFASKDEIKKSVDLMLTQCFLFISSLSALAYTISYSAVLVSDSLSNLNVTKSLYHRFKHSYYKAIGNNSEARSELEKSCELLPVRKNYLDVAKCHLNLGFIDDALFDVERSFKNSAQPQVFTLLENTFLLTPNGYIWDYKKYKRAIKKSPNKVENYLKLAVSYFITDDQESLIKLQKQIEERFPDSIEARALYALILENKDKEAAKSKWSEVVSLILKDKDLDAKFRLVGESSNEVVEYYPREFFRGALIFKKGQKDRLEQEKKWTLDLTNILVNHTKDRVVTPLSIFEHNGYVYAMKREPGTKLADIKDNKEFYFGRAAEFLALIHFFMPRDLTPVDYMSDLHLRLSQCPVFDKEAIKCISTACSDIFYDFNSLPMVFIKDFHGDNTLVNRSREKEEDIILTALDFENKGIGYPGLDTAKLIEQGRIFPNTLYGDQQRDAILDGYIYAFNHISDRGSFKIRSAEEFKFNHLRSTILKALSYYCFSFNRSKKEQVRLEFMDNMIHAINRIKSDFTESYQRFNGQYNALMRIAQEIPVRNEQINRALTQSL